MNSYLLTYDLMRPGQQYTALTAALENAGAVRILYSTWVLRSQSNAAQVRDHFGQFVDGNDRVFVCELNSNWAGWNMLNVDAAKRVLPP